MKKNFLMVAALLIAAMLLVVSCTQEVAPVDNNLVKVTLNTSTARSALNYSGYGDENSGAITYRYKLTAKWNPSGVTGADAVVGNTDAVVGNTNGFITFTGGANSTTQTLNYVSQGLWEVEVIGSINNNDVLRGVTQVYINKNNSNVTVYVKPIEDGNAGITLDVNVNDHDGGSEYKLVYSIEKVDGQAASGIVSTGSNAVTLTNLNMSRGTTLNNGFRNWSATVTGMTPGYYRVTVTMKNGNNVVGGLTKGVLLFAGDTNAKLSGYVNSSDFINGTLNVFYPTVTVSIDDPTITKENHVFVEGEGAVPSYKVTYTATPTISGDNGLGGTPTYTWYADGVKVTGENANNTYDAYYKQTEPGYKTVTCVVKYTFSVTDDAGKEVSYVVQGSKEKTTLVDSVTPNTPSES